MMQADFIQLACAECVATVAGAQQVGVGGERHDECALAAIGLGDGDAQVAPVAGRRQVVEHERAGRDGTSSSNTPRWRTLTRALVSAAAHHRGEACQESAACDHR
jgi:hypothetical protein